MKIYVGRWDLLPEEWKSINGLYEKSEDEIYEEVMRQDMLLFENEDTEGDYVGVYEPIEFEEEFNHSASGWFNSEEYWIKIF